MSSIYDVIVRRATSEDHHAIVMSGDLNSGRDYLPDIYQQVVNDPEVYPVVAELKGQVESRKDVLVLMGIVHKMSKVLDSWAEKRFPDLRHRYESAAACDENSAVDNFHLKDFTERHRKNSRHNWSQFKRRTSCCDVTGIWNTMTSNLYLLSRSVGTAITFKKTLFNFFLGYRCLESNIKHFLSDDREVSVTIKSPYHTHHETTKLSLLQDIDMVSFTYRHIGGAGLVYGIETYTIEANNATSIEAHIFKHLRVLKELSLCDKGVLVVSIGRNACEETVRSLLRQCGIEKRAQITDNWSVLLEKII